MSHVVTLTVCIWIETEIKEGKRYWEKEDLMVCTMHTHIQYAEGHEISLNKKKEVKTKVQ